jgi:hypothetical protein
LPEAFRQQFGRHVVHRLREPCLPVPPCQFTNSVQTRRRATPARCPGRGRMFAIALGCPLPSSASGGLEPPPLFGSFAGTTRASDFSSFPTLGLWRSPFPSAPKGCSPSGNDETSQFLCERFPRMLRVSDRVEPLRGLRHTLPKVLPSAQDNSVGAPDLRFRGSMAPVNASETSSRTLPHDSGPRWVATPFLHRTFIDYPSPVSLAHYPSGGGPWAAAIRRTTESRCSLPAGEGAV